MHDDCASTGNHSHQHPFFPPKVMPTQEQELRGQEVVQLDQEHITQTTLSSMN